ncbi:MAG TPA: hypothetical protein ENJ95_04835 [Bacteroidetes bacterium]|nr:hypothetical protein [Bacteroidota bacterium]
MKKSTSRRTRARRRRKQSTDSFFQKKTKKEAPFFEIGHAGGTATSGKGRPSTAVNFGHLGPVKLKGKTKADYSNNGWKATEEKLKKGTGCEGCKPKKCTEYTGVLVSTFKVSTRVSLPRMSDYQAYSACQKKRIKAAIDDVLAPHEQQHVQAFKTYDGTVKTPFSMTACRKKLKNIAVAKFTDMHEKTEAPRRAAAQAASDALDPFVVNVDLKCK